ncbi:GNAT family N-acetyltransferase [Leptolyngbya ohadii]|uniref:GNAT family N-acetyltransferase n=1 Tax=Leptolyngbya ohadii TaxID=1962290 RepID=UPI0015C6669C|nr:GNAT family N-acetyltransferase [Leptolyngbya ohadii]
MVLTNLSLIKLASEHKQSLLSLVEDFHSAGEYRFQSDLEQIHNDFDVYTQRLLAMEAGVGLSKGMVPQTTLWLVRDNTYLIGKSHLRHQLTPTLKHHGGHIGYIVRPSERGRGYGTRLLKLTLGKARDLGLSRILITCDTDNIPSVRVIGKNGGVLENQLISNVSGVMISRYWIYL